MSRLETRAQTAARIVLGLIFTVFGLNGFLNFIPHAPPTGAAGAFIGALAASGYMIPLLKATEVIAGVLLLTRRAVPFALTLLAPVVVNIVAYHAFLEPSGIVLGVVALALGLYLAWMERAVFAPLFARRTSETATNVGVSAGGHATAT